MNWNQIQYIITIVEEKSISKAAEKLCISQPSLSTSLKHLEEELGLDLFVRNSGEMILTRGGQKFYDWAISTTRSYHILKRQLSEIGSRRRHLVRIGINPDRSRIIMPEVLERFYEICPDSEVVLIEKNSSELRKMIDREELDLMIDTRHPDTCKFSSEPLASECYFVGIPVSLTNRILSEEADIMERRYKSGRYYNNWTGTFKRGRDGLPEEEKTLIFPVPEEVIREAENSPGKPIEIPGETYEFQQFEGDSVYLKQLVDFPFIFLSEEQMPGKTERDLCERVSFYPDIRTICNSMESAISLCERQLGVVIVPQFLAKENPSIRYYKLAENDSGCEICLVTPTYLQPNSSVRIIHQLFLDTVPEIYKEFSF